VINSVVAMDAGGRNVPEVLMQIARERGWDRDGYEPDRVSDDEIETALNEQRKKRKAEGWVEGSRRSR
jgi:hypothetical protein